MIRGDVYLFERARAERQKTYGNQVFTRWPADGQLKDYKEESGDFRL